MTSMDGYPLKRLKAKLTLCFLCGRIHCQSAMLMGGYVGGGARRRVPYFSMKAKQVSLPRRVSFDAANRFMRRYSNTFMSAARGGGWQLYCGYGEKSYHGYHKKWAQIAFVDNTPETYEDRDKYGFWGNWYPGAL